MTRDLRRMRMGAWTAGGSYLGDLTVPVIAIALAKFSEGE